MAQQGTESAVSPVDFADALGRLRRALRRVVRSSVSGQLPSSEIELLALVARSPGIGVGEAAEELHVAPNTVSTLINSLRKANLLIRRTHPRDRRAARLHLTSEGLERLDEIRVRRTSIVNEAFTLLSVGDRKLLVGSVPAIERLISALGSVEDAPDTAEQAMLEEHGNV